MKDKRHIQSFNKHQENINIVNINIPKGIKLYMNKLGIPENKQSELFKEYIVFLLGINYGIEVDSFITWTEENFDEGDYFGEQK